MKNLLLAGTAAALLASFGVAHAGNGGCVNLAAGKPPTESGNTTLAAGKPPGENCND